MIIIDDYKKILNDTRPQIAELAKGLGYERLSNEIEELEMHTHQPDFWQKGLNLGKEYLSELEKLYEQIQKEG